MIAHRVEEELRHRIASGQYAPGAKLPPERQLAAEFGVSRMTLRNAVDALILDGMIERQAGRGGGSFIKHAAPTAELTSLRGLMPELARRGHQVTSQILTAAKLTAPTQVAIALELGSDASVFQVERLRRVDDTPMVIENSFFPARLTPGLLECDLSASLYRLLRDSYGITLTGKVEQISQRIIGITSAPLLGVNHRHAGLRITRIGFDALGRRVEYSEDLYRGDQLRVQVTSGQVPE